MNIFASYLSPIDSAMALDDFRLNKMIVESCQLLSTALWKLDITNRFYKPAYIKHPCTIWTATTKQNFQWVLDHSLAMCMIFEQTNGKIHRTEPVLWNIRDYLKFVPSSNLMEFQDCTKFKHRIDLSVCDRYKIYLNYKWQKDLSKAKELGDERWMPRWSKRKIPDFFIT